MLYKMTNDECLMNVEIRILKFSTFHDKWQQISSEVPWLPARVAWLRLLIQVRQWLPFATNVLILVIPVCTN